MKEHSPGAVSTAPGLYLHLPFCSAICPYCDFSVLTGTAERKRFFVEILRREIELWASRISSDRDSWRSAFDTLYLGGGTPSALTSTDLGRILREVVEQLPTTPRPWIQFEANPEDVDARRCASWRELGIASVSLGVQSFDDDQLRFLGRRHDGATGESAVRQVLAAGFSAVSLDLIFGLPDQTPEAWRDELERAVRLRPHHISCYQLTIHDGTPFGFRQARGQLREMPEEAQGELFRLTHRFLADHGYTAYEVSNFALSEEFRSRHNQKYWHHVPYLGLGPSAHSFAGGRRWWNERKVPAWQRRILAGEFPVAEEEKLSPSQHLLERLFLGLRTPSGVDCGKLNEEFGVDLLAKNTGLIERWSAAGYVDVDGTVVRPTLDGLAISESLAASLEV